MHVRTLPGAALALSVLLCSAGAARAQDETSKVRAVQEPPKVASRAAPPDPQGQELFSPYYGQPVVIPPLILTLNVTGSLLRIPEKPTSYLLELGAAYGLVPRLHVEAVFAPIYLSPEARYGSPRLGFVYSVVKTPPIDVGAKISATLNTGKTGNVIAPLSVGVPLAARAAGVLRVDAGAFLNLGLGKKVDEKTTLGLSVPVSPSVQIARPIALAVDTGFTFADFSDAETAAVPLGFSAVSSIDITKKYGVFLAPFFSWPTFLTPAVKPSVHTDVFVAGMYISTVIDFGAEPE
ncbi:hypothetical protein [Sorangium sp. So ce1153]|uniref:hypothetical protein n=1 Tax=Sorangium sp. So ce1153 TaxID=3133333 RepID=UPI003F641AC0